MSKKKTYIWSFFLIFIIVSFLFLEIKNSIPIILFHTDYNQLKNSTLSVKDAKKAYRNEDIVGYISIPSTSIHTFFTQATNNIDYLDKDLRKKNSILGSIFLDYRNTFHDKQINLYGHNGNIKNAPFYDLNQYKNLSFYQKHPYIFLTLGNQKRTYQIFSTIITTSTEHMNLFFKEEKERQKHILFFTQNSLYDTNVQVNENDSILILQTCTYEIKNAFLLICAKRIKGENL